MMKRGFRGKSKREQQGISGERIDILFGLADKAALGGDMVSANSYVVQARKIAMKFNVRMPKEIKSRYCRYCYRYLLPGKTSRVRVNSREKRVEVECLHCKRKMFYPYIKEVKERREKNVFVAVG